MHGMSLILAVLVAIGSTAVAGEEMVTVPFLEGVYTIDMPGDWDVEEHEDGNVVINPDGSVGRIIISPPNPHVDGDLEGFAGAILLGMSATLDEVEATQTVESDFRGNPVYGVMLEMKIQGVAFGGALSVIDFDGWGVSCMAMAPREAMAEFMPVAAVIMDSYDLDEEAVEANAEILAELGAKALADIAELVE